MIAHHEWRERSSEAGPPLIVVNGGARGVGTTTVAMNVGAALASSGQRVVLVDAARHRAKLTQLAGMPNCAGRSFSDVLAGRSTLSDALVPGPAGMLLLPDRSAARAANEYSRTALRRFLASLQSHVPDSDAIIVDTGNGVSQWAQSFWQHAQIIILPTTCDDATVLETYAAIKLGAAHAQDKELRVLLNRSDNNKLASVVSQRLRSACRQFLGLAVSMLPALPTCSEGDRATEACSLPRVWETPDTPFGHAVMWLGRTVSEIMERHSVSIDRGE